MDALTALHTRNSINLLTGPAPSSKQLENIYKAGLRACDHKNLTPWKYIVIQGEARAQLGELMVKVKTAMDGKPLSKQLSAKLRAKPMRAPTIIAVAAKITAHEKVPDSEQIMSAAASAQMMMVAAHAQSLGAIWRSGGMMFRPEMRAGLGLQMQDHIVGFLYLGTPCAAKTVAERKTDDFVEYWQKPL